ncbi:30S ribosomal protein S8 [Mycoplasmoides genitalium]|uniref:30S ribosomal protein S8 n=1 Tax=Mycoplasmoides genitalium TaxID=2097 RepID=UPI00027B3BD0|nr:30S ribosomal protein S8 [Mycoplasmoides genitalium]AFQ02989.1 30S ribosomal protein S8 [Mycoplasmoides genitalium M2321]
MIINKVLKAHFDPVSDLFTKINNARKAKLLTVTTIASKLKIAILEILIKEGYLANYQVLENKTKTKKLVSFTLKYTQRRICSINGVKQISKPGLRIYRSFEKLPLVLNGLGIAIISTSDGVMTDKVARLKKIGGEILAYVW